MPRHERSIKQCERYYWYYFCDWVREEVVCLADASTQDAQVFLCDTRHEHTVMNLACRTAGDFEEG